MNTINQKALVCKARDFCKLTQEMQKTMNDMYFWEFIELDEEEQRQKLQQEHKET